MGDTNRVQLSMLAESTYGVLPSGDFSILRFTSESLKQVTRTTKSAEIRADRQIPSIVRTGVSGSGSIGIELSYGAHDTLLQYALMSAGWSSPVTVTAATISAASADNSFNDSGSGFGSIVAGQWIKVRGFANAANNGYFKVVSKTSAKLVVSGGTLVTAAASPTITVKMGAQIVNGVTGTSFTIERKYGDLTNTFAALFGCMVDKFSLNAAAEAITTGSFDLILAREESASSAPSGGGYDDAPNNPVMNAVDDLPQIWLNQALIPATAVSLSLANNLRGRMEIDNVGPVSIGSGTCDISGTLEQYFTSPTLIDLYLAFTAFSLAWCQEDALGNSYVIEIPQARFVDGQRPATGQNADVMTPLQWNVERHATQDIMIRITRFAAA